MSSLYKALAHFIKEYMLVLVVIFLGIIFSFMAPAFGTPQNISNMLRQASINAIISLGLLFPVLTGGIDLSVGAVAGFAGVLVAGFMRDGIHWFPAIILVLLVGCMIGATSGFLITFMKIPPFVATLALMTIVEGIKFIYSRSLTIFTDSKPFAVIGGGEFLGIPVPIWLMVFLMLILQFVMSKTIYGRSLYALGGNAAAARLAGINTRTITFSAYVVGALLATFAGVVLASRMESGSPLAGSGFVNNAIASVVIGGGSLAGGRGKPFLVLFGALIIAMVNNQLNLMGVQTHYQRVILGLIIIFAVFFTEYSKNRKTGKAFGARAAKKSG